MAAVELFDLCDEWGQLLGRTKPRDAVHRDGDWHRSFHCWLFSAFKPEPTVIVQRRARDKDTWPGFWDVSVAGHYAAGEGIEGGLRELREEIGLHASARELRIAGRRREEHVHPNGLIDREVQDVYFLERRIDLLVLRVSREVMALAFVSPEALTRLADGSLPRLTAVGSAVDARGLANPGSIEVLASDLVPRPDGYYARVADYARRVARGEPLDPPDWW